MCVGLFKARKPQGFLVPSPEASIINTNDGRESNSSHLGARPGARCCARLCWFLTPLHLPNNSCGRCYHYPHMAGEKTEAHRSKGISRKSPSWSVTEPGFKPTCEFLALCCSRATPRPSVCSFTLSVAIYRVHVVFSPFDHLFTPCIQ